MSLVRCTASQCRRRGLNLNGAFDFLAGDCEFSFNDLEGLAAKDLVGLLSVVTRFVLRDCLFQANGSEGLEIELVAASDINPGSWVVQIEDSDFLDNKSEGLLLDCDYEGLPGWTASVEIRGCQATRNEGSGFQLDLDADATVALNRLVSSSNQEDGILITSETTPSMVTANACALHGNQGYGVHTTLGDVGLILSHSVLAGNFTGGFMADSAPGTAVSSVAYLQPFPWYGVTLAGCVELDENGPNPFEQAPDLWDYVTYWDGQSLRLNGTAALFPGDLVEVGDDSL